MTGSQRTPSCLCHTLGTDVPRLFQKDRGSHPPSTFAKGLPHSPSFFTGLHTHWYFRDSCESMPFATSVGVSRGGSEERHKMPLSTAGYLCGWDKQLSCVCLSPAPPRWHTCLCAQFTESPGLLAHLQGLGHPTQAPHL